MKPGKSSQFPAFSSRKCALEFLFMRKHIHEHMRKNSIYRKMGSSKVAPFFLCQKIEHENFYSRNKLQIQVLRCKREPQQACVCTNLKDRYIYLILIGCLQFRKLCIQWVLLVPSNRPVHIHPIK